MKGNIPSKCTPFFFPLASTPSFLSPLQPLNLYSRATHQAGPSMEIRKLVWELGACCLQAKGKWVWDICLGERGHVPSYEPELSWQPCSRDLGEITKSETPSAKGHNMKISTQWMSIITHIVLAGPVIWEIIKQISLWRTENLGKICWAYKLFRRIGKPQYRTLRSKFCHNYKCRSSFVVTFFMQLWNMLLIKVAWKYLRLWCRYTMSNTAESPSLHQGVDLLTLFTAFPV